MKIVHEYTIKISKGWQSILKVTTDDNVIGLVVRHAAKTSRAMSSDMKLIEQAISREKIHDRYETITKEISNEIETALIEWLSKELGVEYRYIRWQGNRMLGFSRKEQVEEYDREEDLGSVIPIQPRKKRIMLG